MKKTLSRSLALVLALAAGVLPAKEQDAPIPGLPAYGKDKPLVLPEVKETRLENGLSLWLIERHDLPLVSVYLAVRGGKASDPGQLRGLSELLPDTLVAGTKNRSARRIAEELQGVGAEMSASVGKEVTYIGVAGLASGSNTLLEILADVATASSFPEGEVKLAIENRVQSIIASRSQPDWALNQVFQRRIFGDHPYGFVNPDPEVIRRVTRKDLLEVWKRRFRPDQAILVMVGDLPATEMEALARRHFGHWRPTGGVEAGIPPAPLQPRPGLVLVDRPGSVQSTLFVGRAMPPAGNADEFALQVANTIFGGAFGSRLVMNIREEKGYTYSPRAALVDWPHGGLFEVSASVRNAVTAATLVEIFYELDRLATTLPEQEELVRAQRYLKGRFLLANETAASLAATLTGYWVDGKKPGDLAKYVPGIDAVDADTVRRMGREYLASRKQTVAISGDAAQIRSQLELFGEVELSNPEP